MNKNMWRTTLREIRASLGRYLAIFAIIALGVGFFSGLKVSREAFLDAGNSFIADNNMFDFRLVSTLGLTGDDLEEVRKLSGVEYAYGAYQADAIVKDGEKEFVVRFHSEDENVNKLSLTAGRLAEKPGEIVADARHYNAGDIGKHISISENNKQEISGRFKTKEYEIVGIAYSTLYLNYERGTTSVGNGSISCFFFMTADNFDLQVYTDIYVTMTDKYEIYLDEYNDMISSGKDRFKTFLEEQSEKRFKPLSIFPGQSIELLKPSLFVLTRSENIGYVCFENDSSIVEGIAVVFPVFFFLVAALVCVTTMSRMIEEQRTQIGVLKALGYSDAVIMGKYMIYSGSAALIGCIGGFFLGCKVFPAIIWKVYGLMYGFSEIKFVFNPLLFLISLAVAVLCSVGTTWISCKKDLKMMAAGLMRPKAPKTGKRIFLERIGWIWRKIPFLHKVSIRNVFRYRGRFFMMMLGIGGCAGLLVTGYGIRDSITEIAEEQYSRILVYDELVNFSEEMKEDDLSEFYKTFVDKTETFMPIYQTSVDPVDTGAFRSVNLTVLYGEDKWKDVLLLHDDDGNQLEYPKEGEVILTENVAKANSVKTGDYITFRDSGYHELELKVSGICENYFNSYAYIGSATYKNLIKEDPPYRSAFIVVKNGTDLHEAAASFMNDKRVSAVSVNADTREMFSKMMQTMNYIVILVIACAAALAFIVLYNLTNINITERIREIATIKVLGFYAGETASYVFRENMALTLMGAVVGLPMGIALHRYVMSNINIEMVTFDIHVNGISFVYAVLYTIAFALFVDLVMYFKLAKINMAESLKSVE